MRYLREEYLEALGRVADAATPGPWTVGLEIDGPLAGCPVVVRTDGIGNRSLRIVTVGATPGHVRGPDDKAAVANTAFIAASRDAVARLLAENRYLRTLLDLSTIGEGRDGTE